MIIKNIERDYFFYGAVQLYNYKNKNKFIKEMLREIKLENVIREERKRGVIEWEIDKEQTSKKENKQ